MNLSLERLMTLMEFLHGFRQVKRHGIPYPEGGGGENDAEHALQLTIVAWYIVDALKLPLDLTKVMMYCLAHDLVEVYAGDVSCHKHDPEKKAREHASAERMKQEFPDFPTLHEMISAYERREDAESKFVWALDKFVPIINVRISKQPEWRKWGVTLESLLRLKDLQVMSSEILQEPYAELVEFLHANPQLFADPTT